MGGSRLVVAAGSPPRTGAALVRAACARAEAEGALRFDAIVQADKERFFSHLGWLSRGRVELLGHPHVRMRWPIGLIAAQAAAKQVIAEVLGDLRPGGEGFVGDDGAPIPDTDLVAATDAILPSMVERDPWWAGWCSVLVNVNDLAAMGAAPVGLLDSVAAPNASMAKRVMAGLADAAARYGVPVLGGHTQVGAPSALAVTMLGRAAAPVPGGGGRPGDRVSVIADLAGGWREGYGGRQWDSTTARSADDLRRLTSVLDRVQVRAAKDVSMAGLVGTLGMLAEASGCGAELDVAAVPRPDDARLADWFTCFPGFALVVAGDRPIRTADAAPASVATCGRLVGQPGVTLVWPDGERTRVLDGPVVGLGRADQVTLPVAENGGLRTFRVSAGRRARRRPTPAWARCSPARPPSAGPGPGPAPPPCGPTWGRTARRCRRPARWPTRSAATARAPTRPAPRPTPHPGVRRAAGRSPPPPRAPRSRAPSWPARPAARPCAASSAGLPNVAPVAQGARPPYPRGGNPADAEAEAGSDAGAGGEAGPGDGSPATRRAESIADARLRRAGDLDPSIDGIGPVVPFAPRAADRNQDRPGGDDDRQGEG